MMYEAAQTIHVVPLNDLKRHIEHGLSCPCAPFTQENGKVIVHNSWDGREFLEFGNTQDADSREARHSPNDTGEGTLLL